MAGTGIAPQLAPGALDRAFFEAAARGELLYQCCPTCGHRQFYPRALCTACGSDPGLGDGLGPRRGTHLHDRSPERPGAVPGRAALRVAMVELEEGVRMMGNVTGCPVEDVRIGMPVEAYAVECGDGMAVPFWRPSARSEI